MQRKTQSHKPGLDLRLGKITRRKRLTKISEVVEEVVIRIENFLNVEPTISPLLEHLEIETQLEEETTPSKLISSEIDKIREEVHVEID
jgi:hypothetical protein